MTQQSLFDSKREAAARDAALDMLEWSRAKLVARGRTLALALCSDRGRVTSTMVMDALKLQAQADPGLAAELDKADPRWMGAVFRAGNGWRRAGWEATGSHKRPVAIWTR